MHELRGAAEPPLDYLLDRMQHCDRVLIDGFKDGEVSDAGGLACGGG